MPGQTCLPSQVSSAIQTYPADVHRQMDCQHSCSPTTYTATHYMHTHLIWNYFRLCYSKLDWFPKVSSWDWLRQNFFWPNPVPAAHTTTANDNDDDDDDNREQHFATKSTKSVREISQLCCLPCHQVSSEYPSQRACCYAGIIVKK